MLPVQPSANVGTERKASGSPRELTLPWLSARMVSLPGITLASPGCFWDRASSGVSTQCALALVICSEGARLLRADLKPPFSHATLAHFETLIFKRRLKHFHNVSINQFFIDYLKGH